MECNEVYKEIILILKKRFHFPDELFEGDVLNLPLCGNHFRMSTTELVYLFYEVERAFQVHITDDILKEYGFHSIWEIGECITALSKISV
jgi:hypothetical protein